MSRGRFIAGLLVLVMSLGTVAARAEEPDGFNYVVGTQTIGAKYQFTAEPKLVETARVIRQMGSNVLKFSTHENASKASLTEMVSQQGEFRQVLEMPFAYYLIWVYGRTGTNWRNGLSKEEAEAVYQEMYDLVRHLLITYSGTDKTFLLGHWEGDWHLRPNYDPKAEIPEAAIAGMIDWLNTRQRAVDQAKRDTPHQRVQVWHYTEANLVQIGLKGQRCLTNDVLPRTSVDFVSYSSYDSLGGDLRANLLAALNHIESKLPAKPGVGIGGKRVFIGEYGFPANRHGAQQQDEKSRQVMKAGLEWGCPFVLYWELYCNEIEKGTHRGFWMIDDKGQRQPIYHTHERLYREGRRLVEETRKSQGRPPTAEEYRRFALGLLDEPASAGDRTPRTGK